jgi:hypothetical protein
VFSFKGSAVLFFCYGIIKALANTKLFLAIGLKATKYMENGQLVPDDIITDLVMEALQTHGGNTHWILDGKEQIFVVRNNKK